MHPPYSALTIILFGLSAMFLLAAAGRWVKLSKYRERPDEAPVIPVHAFRTAAGYTAVALGALAFALLWFALVILNH